MFAILVPASLSPLIVTLFWAEQKAKRLGLVPAPTKPQHTSLGGRAWAFAQQLDIIGLLLIGTSVALILLPLTLSQTARGGWDNASMIAMLVVGVVLLFVFTLWDGRYAARPVVPPRFLRNRAFLGAAWIGFFDFVRSLL